MRPFEFECYYTKAYYEVYYWCLCRGWDIRAAQLLADQEAEMLAHKMMEEDKEDELQK
jgi:hypothetical protein